MADLTYLACGFVSITDGVATASHSPTVQVSQGGVSDLRSPYDHHGLRGCLTFKASLIPWCCYHDKFPE